MRQETTTSFEKPIDQIDEARVLHRLTNETNFCVKSGREGWTCAWSSDGAYFGWSSGLRILHLIPWNYQKSNSKIQSNNQRKYISIDCGEIVWSLAFGECHPQKASHMIRNRCSKLDKNPVVAAGLASGRIKIFNCYTGSVIAELLDHKETVRGLDFSKDDKFQLLSASRDGTLKLWDLYSDGNMYFTQKINKAKLNACKYSPNGKFVAAVGASRVVVLWRGQLEDTPMDRLSGHANEVVSVDFSPDSTFMATASFDTRVIIWSTYTAQSLKVLGHLHPSPSLIFAGGANNSHVRSVSFSCDGVSLGTVCDDGYARIWHWEKDGDPVAVAEVNDPLTCRFSHNGSIMAVGTRTGDALLIASPNPIPSLLQMSRVAVRKAMQLEETRDLPVPRLLKNYLGYLDDTKILNT